MRKAKTKANKMKDKEQRIDQKMNERRLKQKI